MNVLRNRSVHYLVSREGSSTTIKIIEYIPQLQVKECIAQSERKEA